METLQDNIVFMKKVYINISIQSISDIITNSSSEIYLVTGGTKYVRELIDTLLKLAESDYTCDELFEVEDLDDCYQIRALDNSNSKIAETIEELINNLFWADGEYNY